MTGGGDAGVRAELQSRVTALLLGAVGDAGFVLAGAGAIRQHGLTDRPTEDVDLFTVPTTTAEQFGAALDAAETALRGAGFEVSGLGCRSRSLGSSCAGLWTARKCWKWTSASTGALIRPWP